ncbi:MAG: hypothetical protein ACRDS1_03310 [Pseudonocardiaceae bacterium]
MPGLSAKTEVAVAEHRQRVETTAVGKRVAARSWSGFGPRPSRRVAAGSSLYQVGLVIKFVWTRRGGLTRG